MDAWLNLRTVGIVIGAVALVSVPATVDIGSASTEGSNNSLVRPASVCAQSHICGYVDGPTCPSDPYSQCEVGCDEDALRPS